MFGTAEAVEMSMFRFSILAICFFAVFACVKARTPLVVTIPGDYLGWVRIEYGVPEMPPLQKQDGSYVIAVPKSGIVRTSSQFETGFADDKYYFVDQGGQKTELHEASQSDSPDGRIRARQMFAIGTPEQKERIFWAFYVGTQSQYQQAVKDPKALPLP